DLLTGVIGGIVEFVLLGDCCSSTVNRATGLEDVGAGVVCTATAVDFTGGVFDVVVFRATFVFVFACVFVFVATGVIGSAPGVGLGRLVAGGLPPWASGSNPVFGDH